MDERTTEPERTITTATGMEAGPLFAEEQGASYRSRWDEIQAQSWTIPGGRPGGLRAREHRDRRARIVVPLRRDSLEPGWQQGDDTSIESLRLALQAYRSFFGRLLST